MPQAINIQNFHVIYQDVTSQHWHPASEHYAGGDNLMTALENGWGIEKCLLTRHWYAGMRSVQIYEFLLSRNGEEMTMPVVSNPYVYRIVSQEDVNLVDPQNQLHA